MSDIKRREPWEPQGVPFDDPAPEPTSPRIKRPWESDAGYAARMKELDDELAAARHESAPGDEDEVIIEEASEESEPQVGLTASVGERVRAAQAAHQVSVERPESVSSVGGNAQQGASGGGPVPVIQASVGGAAPSPPKVPGKWQPGKPGRPPKNRDQAVVTRPQASGGETLGGVVRASTVGVAGGGGDYMGKNPKQPTLQDKPIDIINQTIANGYTDVNVLIRRRNNHGRMETLQPGVILPTSELLNIEAYCMQLGGGGNYEVESRNPINLGEFLIPRFVVVIAGQMKPSPNAIASSPGAAPPYTSAGFGPPVGGGIPSFAAAGGGPPTPEMYDQFGRLKPPPGLPPFYTSLPVDQQWGIWQQLNPNVKLPTGASMHSDQVAMYAEQRAQAEKVTMAAQVATAQAEVRRLTEQLAETKVKAAEAQHKTEVEALRTEMRALAERLSQPQQKAPDTLGQLAQLAPFVPVLVAMVQNSKSSQEMALTQQTTMMNTVLSTLSAKKPDSQTMDMIKVMAPLAIPIVVKLLDQRSPDAMAQANIQTLQAQTAMMEFMGDFIEKHKEQSPEEPWWYPMVTQGIEAVKGMVMQRQMQMAGAPPQALPQQSVVAQAVQAVKPKKTQPLYEVDPNDPSHWDELGKQDKQAAEMTRQVFQQLPADLGMHKHEWKILVFNLHLRLDPQEFAEFFADHIEHEVMFGKLPPVLRPIVEKPTELIAQMIGMMPIAKMDPAYAQKVVECCATEIVARIKEREQAEKDMAAEEAASAGDSGGPEASVEDDAPEEDDEASEEDGVDGGEGEEVVEGEEEDGEEPDDDVEDGVVVFRGTPEKQPTT